MAEADEGRVLTTKIPSDMAKELDQVAKLIDRSKSWIVRDALGDWLAEHRRRHELTLEALKDVDEGRTLTHEEVLKLAEERKRSVRARVTAR